MGCISRVRPQLGRSWAGAHGSKGPTGEAAFLFLYFLKIFFTEIYFRFHNLQFYTPTARQGAAETYI